MSGSLKVREARADAHPTRQVAFRKLIAPGGPLEGRSLEDCQQCYEHLWQNRVAYFGHAARRSKSAELSPPRRRSSASSQDFTWSPHAADAAARRGSQGR